MVNCSVQWRQIRHIWSKVLNYRSALYKGFNLVKEHNLLTTNTILAVQEELEHNKAGIRKLPGTKLVNDKTGKVMYTPPESSGG